MRSLVGRVLDAFPDYAGAVFFFGSLALGLAGALYNVYGPSLEDDVPFGIVAIFMVGLLMLLYSFIRAARSSEHAWPTVPVLSFVYMFSMAMMLVILRRVDDISWLPTIPDPIMAGSRWMLYGIVFVAGLVLVVGEARDWNRMRANPWPLGWLWGLGRRRRRREGTE